MSSFAADRSVRSRRSSAFIAAAVLGLSIGGVAAVSSYALLTVLLDGLTALLIVIPPALAGLWLVPLFRLGPLPCRWHLLLGAALGLGATSILVLLLGLIAIPQRPFWVVLLTAMAAAGAVRLRILLESDQIGDIDDASKAGRQPTRLAALWLLAAPFLTLALLAASHPPGLLWEEEGYGYDILEYHLQLPKEYVQNAQITYLPHNVYANFPANVEMLYLLAMVVLDDARDAGTVANMIHLLLAVLAVFAVWAAARDWSPAAGVVGGLATAATGWLPYLSGLAYVEHGLLFFEASMLAVVLRLLRTRDGSTVAPVGVASPHPTDHNRWWLLAGVMGGLACGCKYTAVAMVVAPAAVLFPWISNETWSVRLAKLLVFLFGAGLSFSPWLAKNQFMTGNPVFPLANGLFQAAPPGWGAEETERWDRGHRTTEDRSRPADRLRTAWTYLVHDSHQRIGPLLLLFGSLGLLRRRCNATDTLLGGVAALQLAVWIGFTHLFARFAVVLIVPLGLLAGRAWTHEATPRRKRVLVASLVLGACFNAYFAGLLQSLDGVRGIPAAVIYDGKIPGFEIVGIVNRTLSSRGKLLLVGEARVFYFFSPADYCVAFNRNPFLAVWKESRDPQAVLAWLRSSGITHVVVHWGEVRRIARTYGFSPSLSHEEIAVAFVRLREIGLRPIHRFSYPGSRRPYAELLVVPPENQP